MANWLSESQDQETVEETAENRRVQIIGREMKTIQPNNVPL
jgi:hypothetical protein